jgi:SAM-dependent methyltransferase
VPLAQRQRDGGRVVGIDFLPDSLAAARRHADAAGVANVELVEGDLLTALRTRPDAEFDAAVFLEVAFVLTDLDAVLRELARVVKPGGRLLASFRTRFYWLQMAALRRDPALLATVRGQTSGTLPAAGWQTWHGGPDAVAQLGSAGFGDVTLRGVGALSGIEGDPLAAPVRPSQLGTEAQRALAAAEDEVGESHPDAGRYMPASAVRSG